MCLDALVAANSSPWKEPLRFSPQAKRSLAHVPRVELANIPDDAVVLMLSLMSKVYF